MRSISIAHSSGHKAITPGVNYSVARTIFCKWLANLSNGCLRLHEAGEVTHYGQAPEESDLVADIHVLDPQLYTNVLFGGSIGAGEAYISGHWETNDLTAVIRLFARNLAVLDKIDANQSLLSKLLLRLFSVLRRNSKSGSRDNISAHYDLGNDFFKFFLDQNMMYSSAIYPAPDASLEQAAQYKLQRVCEKLQLSPDDHLLEIGTGWGGGWPFMQRVITVAR